MKRIIQFFAVCLALSVFQTGVSCAATQQKNTSKRDNSNVVSSTHSNTRTSTTNKQSSERVEDTEKSRVSTAKPTRNVKPAVTQNKETSVKSRSAATQKVKQRANTTTKKSVSKVARTTTTKPAVHVVESRQSSNTNRSATKTISRATRTQAMLNDEKIAKIKNNTYSKCKTLFYECMDEFCANKDSSLRRCACSSRIHEFDKIKKQLNDAEDKMLDFNQRLLTVSLSKEDAAAINVASEGEIGFNKKDRTESEKLLQKITNTLNSDGNSKISNDLSAISLSLDVDSAFDSIDSGAGISTTTKNGVELYNAALPTCIEMAKEVCSEDNLDIVQGNYKLAIQQDCETVSKSYSTQYNNAITKINESSALLDMARLNTYQSKNSDDVLTCRKKILDQLYDSAVCGNDLYKCLDTTGQYINPSTGEAFLSTELYNITTLLTAPTGDETWATMSQNEKFVVFLNSKKEYLTTATSQCQNMVPVIWKDFMNDALGKIKLAQDAKLEEIRQSCTTLVAQCRSDATQTLSDFDARALSTFNVLADTTIASLCTDVQQSCLALIKHSGGGDDLWNTGITTIAKDTSYDAIIDTCTTLGKDCIIQQCNGTSGNFALCQNYTSQTRRAILSRKACWNEVYNCVKQSINAENITTDNTLIVNNDNKIGFYKQMYGIQDITTTDVPVLCNTQRQDKACLIAEQIWGNCEHNPVNTPIRTTASNSDDVKTQPTNKILIPASGAESLLSWLAKNTDTETSIDSCNAYKCPVNYYYNDSLNTCVMFFNGEQICGYSENSPNGALFKPTTIDDVIASIYGRQNYCAGGRSSVDKFGNCCASKKLNNEICVPDGGYHALYITSLQCQNPPADSTNTDSVERAYYCFKDYIESEEESITRYNNSRKIYMYCVTTDTTIPAYSDTAICKNGFFVLVDEYGNYFDLTIPSSQNSQNVRMEHYGVRDNTCVRCKYQWDSNKWGYPNSGCTNNSRTNYVWEDHSNGGFTVVYNVGN